jgi:hypothetical protein
VTTELLSDLDLKPSQENERTKSGGGLRSLRWVAVVEVLKKWKIEKCRVSVQLSVRSFQYDAKDVGGFSATSAAAATATTKGRGARWTRNSERRSERGKASKQVGQVDIKRINRELCG